MGIGVAREGRGGGEDGEGRLESGERDGESLRIERAGKELRDKSEGDVCQGGCAVRGGEIRKEREDCKGGKGRGGRL